MPSQPVDKLFDDIQRLDSSYALATESTFDWLNRVDRDDCARVRALLEEWYSHYPDEWKADLRPRFQKRNEVSILALVGTVCFTLYRLLGYKVTVHPDVPGSDRKPDFLVERDATSMYIECAVVFPGDTASKLTPGIEEYICDYINTISNSNFFVGLRISQVGTQQPKAIEITRSLEEWLAKLNTDDQEPERTEIPVRDWKLTYTAIPRDPDKRGESRRLLGVLPSSGVFVVNDVDQIRGTLRGKGGRYGTPDKPLTIAVLNRSPFGGENDMTDAVFGSIAVQGGGLPPELVRRRHGYWRGTRGGTRVSGVLFGQNLNPWSVATTLPRMWINPWASRPILETETNPFATFTANDEGELVRTDGTRTTHEVFDLPEAWPN
jgi:hypothetical protein